MPEGGPTVVRDQIRGDVEFDRVTLRYGAGGGIASRQLVLNDANTVVRRLLAAPAGEVFTAARVVILVASAVAESELRASSAACR